MEATLSVKLNLMLLLLKACLLLLNRILLNMVLLKNGKMKIDNHRFILNVSFNLDTLPHDSLITADVSIIRDKEFFTLKDIAEYLDLTYPTVRNIYKGVSANQGGKWIGRKMCPTITISKL